MSGSKQCCNIKLSVPCERAAEWWIGTSGLDETFSCTECVEDMREPGMTVRFLRDMSKVLDYHPSAEELAQTPGQLTVLRFGRVNVLVFATPEALKSTARNLTNAVSDATRIAFADESASDAEVLSALAEARRLYPLAIGVEPNA